MNLTHDYKPETWKNIKSYQPTKPEGVFFVSQNWNIVVAEMLSTHQTDTENVSKK